MEQRVNSLGTWVQKAYFQGIEEEGVNFPGTREKGLFSWKMGAKV